MMLYNNKEKGNLQIDSKPIKIMNQNIDRESKNSSKTNKNIKQTPPIV